MFNSGMEPDIRKFLTRVLNSMSMVLLWLMINATFGIYLGWGLFGEGALVYNVIFYTWFMVSFVFLFMYLRRKWKH